MSDDVQVETICGYEVHQAAMLFPMITGDEFEQFVDDIDKQGQRDPLILVRSEDGMAKLLDGRNRGRACERLGIKPDVDYYEGDDPIGYVLSVNIHRRHLQESQRALAAAKLKPLYEEEARQRQLEGLKQNQQETLPEVEIHQSEDGDVGGDEESAEPVVADRPAVTVTKATKGAAREHAAKSLNVGARTVGRAEKVLENGVPELIRMVEDGTIRVELAEALCKRPPKQQLEAIEFLKKELEESKGKNPRSIIRRYDKNLILSSIRSEPMPLPEGPFRVIAADYPWQYEKRAEDGTQRGQTPYPTMSIEEGIQMGPDVRKLAHLDSILWFWTTNAHMEFAFDIVKAWGFQHKTILTWKKTKMGTGDWLRGITEHCIMAVRGAPKVDLTNQTTYFEAPASKNHSEKPDKFYEIVEELCPGSKLEMFSRKGRDNWHSWGGEAGKFDGDPES